MNRPKPSISQKARVDFLYLDSVFDKHMIKHRKEQLQSRRD